MCPEPACTRLSSLTLRVTRIVHENRTAAIHRHPSSVALSFSLPLYEVGTENTLTYRPHAPLTTLNYFTVDTPYLSLRFTRSRPIDCLLLFKLFARIVIIASRTTLNVVRRRDSRNAVFPLTHDGGSRTVARRCVYVVMHDVYTGNESMIAREIHS